MSKWKRSGLQNRHARVRFPLRPPTKPMNKKIIVTILLLSLFVFVYKSTLAEGLSSEKAYADFQFSQQVYTNSSSDFEDARDFYIKNETLTLKEDARKKLLKMLSSRDQLELVYITALRTKIVESKGLDESSKSSVFSLIDSEVAWYKDHQLNYKDGDPLEDLFNKSKESESRYKTNTLPIIYETLFLISLGDQVSIRLDNEAEYQGLKTLVSNGVSNGKLDMNPFNRWFSDIESVINTLKTNEEKAKKQISAIHSQSYSTSSSYYSSISTLEDSVVPLSQLNNFLIEVLTSIRNQQ